MTNGHRLMMAAALCVVALGLSGCGDSYSWHQKMTVEVETPDGVKSGSAVTSIKWKDNAFSGGWGGAPMHLEARGEAVVVDFGEVARPRYLFALLKGGAGTSDFIGSVAAASISGKKGRVINKELFGDVMAKRGASQAPITLPVYQHPLLVAFDDITKPETVKRVDSENLAAVLGAGYALKSITLEITDGPVTDGQVGNFIFFKKLKSQATLSGLRQFDPEKPDPVNYLTNKAFKLGE